MNQLFMQATYNDGETEQEFIGYVEKAYWNKTTRNLKFTCCGEEDEFTEVKKLNVSYIIPDSLPIAYLQYSDAA